jgi:Leucine-rich repeat (LRR) protein
MKTKFLFHGMARVCLMVVIAVSFLAIPDQTQTVLAKPLSGVFKTCVAQTQIPGAECNALRALYNSTNGASWTDHTGWLQTDTPCSWHGVFCVSETNVTHLNLSNNHLIGSIPTELGSLTKLQYLNLGSNQLIGSIPTGLGSLANLMVLYLYGNGLTGYIPPVSGLANLAELDLRNNYLTGYIPPVDSLTKLTYLNLSTNRLSGSIPSGLSNLAKLTYLNLSENQLVGSIPPVDSLTNLTYLDLSEHSGEGGGLTGSIPAGVGSLTKLKHLDLYDNYLSGPIPTQWGSPTALTYLDLSYNQLSGSIPAGLGGLTQLTHLDLSMNHQLTGSIPKELGDLTDLQYLDLAATGLTGRIPTQLGNLTNLTWLELHNNLLTGEIPASIVKLTHLTHLTLSCGLDSSNSTVIAFLNARDPGWQNYLCLPSVTLKSSGAQDGWVLESSETSGIGGAMNSSATTLRLGDSAAKQQYRSILSFSTGSLPDTAVIIYVTLKVEQQSITGGGDPVTIFGGFVADIKNGFFSTTSALQVSDFQVSPSKTYGPFDAALASNWYTLYLTGAGPFVNKLDTNGGLTQIRLRFKLDDNNNTAANYLSLFSGDAPAASRPQLVVTYYVP